MFVRIHLNFSMDTSAQCVLVHFIIMMPFPFVSVSSFNLDFSLYWDFDITRGSLYTLITHPSSCSPHFMHHPEFLGVLSLHLNHLIP